MIPITDVVETEEKWSVDLISDLILSVRSYQAQEIGNPKSFWLR